MDLGFVLDGEDLQRRYPMARLLQPIGGLMPGVMRMTAEHTAPDFEIATTRLENLTKIFPHVAGSFGRDALSEAIGGAGSDADPELAWVRAVAEGLERYASLAFHDGDFLVSTGLDLGNQALDLDELPRCSQREYSDPKCPFKVPDKRKLMRWVQSYSLTERRTRYIPAVMAHLYMKPWPSEMIWPMISTGTALHTSLVLALTSAIREVIERDAIALTWLARLPLPRVVIEEPVPAQLATNYSVLKRSLVHQHFFDATTDVGIPTIYSLQLLDGGAKLAQHVSCATEFEAATACSKTIREAAPSRAVFQHIHDIPTNVTDFTSLYDGATYLSSFERRNSFSFLLESSTRKSLLSFPSRANLSENEQLRTLLSILKGLNMEVFVVDLTTDELRAVGLWVVRAVIPALMPMSVIHRGRFLAHPRLYAYPEQAGFGRLNESGVNPEPQPFA